ncbi:MAG TPA: cell division protein FtsA [Steroidobacter sp.]|uniref:cell division protein FtsA n=1 Tax=Steroidobacter sp. TaxID=1978227 RepID=UPI002EDA0983
MDDRNDHGSESSGSGSHTGQSQSGTRTRIGLDVGTSKVVSARGDNVSPHTEAQLNAFFDVPYSALHEQGLKANRTPFYREDDRLIVYGDASEKFAHIFNANVRRPMAKGILNPSEPMATHVLETVLSTLVPVSRNPGELLAFSVPAAATETGHELTYHEETIKRYLKGRGYTPLAVNEGLAVVLAELAKEGFTGIGISCGGGMCNVAISYLSIPSLTMSLGHGGDFIDSSVGAVVNEPATRVKAIKEETLDLTREGGDKIDKALHIYYDKLIESLVEELGRAVQKTQKLPRNDQPMPIVLAGGTSKPNGFRDRFEKALRRRSWPFQIGEVRMASDPLTATARGALVAALAER